MDEATRDNDTLPTAVWLSWHRSGRSIDMASALGVRLTAWQIEAAAPIRHTLSALWTVGVLAGIRPRVILLQHSFLLSAIVGAYKRLRAGAVVVIADCHTKALRRGMSGFASRIFDGIRGWSFRQMDLLIVANDGLLEEASMLGPPVVVQPDILPTPPGESVSLQGSVAGPIVVVGSFAEDEPIDELFGAARLLPDIDFALTGRAPAHLSSDSVPDNVSLVGFLPDAEYWALMGSAGAIVVLTKDEDCLLRGAYEALALGLPLVTSDTRALRDYFGESAMFVRPDERGIAAGISDVLTNRDAWAVRMRELREIRLGERAAAVSTLRSAIAARLPVR